MANSVNQTAPGLFSFADMPVQKSIPSQPSEPFETAMRKAQPQLSSQSTSVSQDPQSSQKTSQSNSKSDTKKTDKTTKGKHTHKKTDRVGKQDDADDDGDAEQAGAVTAADAVADDATDDADQQGGKNGRAKDAAAVQVAGKASKTDPLLQALATPGKAANIRSANVDDEDDADGKSAAANATALKTPAKKAAATTAKGAATQKKVNATDDADDAEQAQDDDDAVDQVDNSDASQQAVTKQTKSKAIGLGAANDDQPGQGVGPATKTNNAQSNQQTAAQQQASDDAAAAAAVATTASPQVSSSDAPTPSDSGSSSATSIDHLTALATDLTSGSVTQGKSAVTATATQTAKADGATGTQAFTPPEVQFADSNHAKIVGGIQGQLLPGGGTMQIRLDPPELGALQVSVHMQNGVMNATFQTSNDDATKVLSHSLSQLKQALETQGVSVDKLHVQQAPRDHQATGDDQQKNQSPSEQSQQKQEQQRRELLQRMWKRLTNGSDPLDMVA